MNVRVVIVLFPSISNCYCASQSFFQQMMRREKRRREYSAYETNTGDDDKKEIEEMDTKRLIYGELSTKRRRTIPENEENLPTDNQHVSASSVCILILCIYIYICVCIFEC